MTNEYRVTLTDEERQSLRELLHKGKVGSRTLNRAHILLLSDEGESDETITEALHTSLSTVHRVRQQFVEGSFEQSLTGTPAAWTAPEITWPSNHVFSRVGL